MIVLGLGYGDEGKGLVTSFLCSVTKNPLVVRFNGGHQAGHTVVHDGVRHVFSSFGSGTLQGVPTFWSKYCTFSPTAFVKEYSLLKEYNPVVYVDPLAMVTTPFDVHANRKSNSYRERGSVGVGFGFTIQRTEQHYTLYAKDMYFETVFIQKLRRIAKAYTWNDKEAEEEIQAFMIHVRAARQLIRLTTESILQEFTPIFEGAQGIMLDMDHGFFPNVTRSHTTSKNAHEMFISPDAVWYVTRAYATRHGNGFFPNEEKLALQNNENETNKTNEFQGEFRTAKLSPEMIRYALACDAPYSAHLEKNLVITCMDQYDLDVNKFIEDIGGEDMFETIYLSFTPDSKDMMTLDDYRAVMRNELEEEEAETEAETEDKWA